LVIIITGNNLVKRRSTDKINNTDMLIITLMLWLKLTKGSD